MDDREIQQLFSLRNEYRSLRYDLGNMRLLCEALGHPQERFRSALIAGTNGKGSVARWLAAIVEGSGLYVSPHLERLNERISIGGREIGDDALDEALRAVNRAAEDPAVPFLHPPTYFERVTAAAFLIFEARTRYAVVEVGLGGRLDATNVLGQDVSVITSIALDHQEHLGGSLEEIAREKAGIIKEREPVLVGVGCDYAAIQERAGGRLVPVDGLALRPTSLGGGYFEVEIETPVRRYSGLRPRLAGRHQLENLAVAIRAAEHLEAAGWPIDAGRIREGVNAATWPGRLESIGARPRFLLDGGHNPAAAAALARYLAEFHPDGVWIVFGVMAEKDWPAMLETLRPHAKQFIFTHPSNQRAADPFEMAVMAPGARVIEKPADAVHQARASAAPGDTILVTGSLYLMGEVRPVVKALSEE